MGARDKASNKAQELKGQVKETVGSATGNEDLRTKGKTDQTKASLSRCRREGQGCRVERQGRRDTQVVRQRPSGKKLGPSDDQDMGRQESLMKNAWKGLIVGALTGMVGGSVMDMASGARSKTARVAHGVIDKAPAVAKAATHKAADMLHRNGRGEQHRGGKRGWSVIGH